MRMLAFNANLTAALPPCQVEPRPERKWPWFSRSMTDWEKQYKGALIERDGPDVVLVIAGSSGPLLEAIGAHFDILRFDIASAKRLRDHLDVAISEASIAAAR